MTDTDFEALGARAAASPHWRLMGGMLTTCGGRVLAVRDGVAAVVLDGQFSGRICERAAAELLPDLRDPATRGCLLELVRKAWRDRGICVSLDGTRWVHELGGGFLFGGGEDADGRWGPSFNSEAEALVSALEYATAHAANSSVTTTGNPTS